MQEHEHEEPTNCGFDRVIYEAAAAKVGYDRATFEQLLALARSGQAEWDQLLPEHLQLYIAALDGPPSDPWPYDRKAIYEALQAGGFFDPVYRAYYALEREAFAEALVIAGDPTVESPKGIAISGILESAQRSAADHVRDVLSSAASATQQPYSVLVDELRRAASWKISTPLPSLSVDVGKEWRGIFFDDMPQRRSDQLDAFAWASSALFKQAKEYPQVSQPPFSFWWERDDDAERGQFDLTLAWELDAPLYKPYIEITIWRVSIWIGWFDIDSVRFY